MVRKVFVHLRLLCAMATLFVAIPLICPPHSYAFTARNLVYGSQGYDVDELQSRLRLLGYYWGKIDGDFGWKTYWAVRTFQYNFGMKVTGEVDMATKLKLVKATPNWHYQSSTGQGTSQSGASSQSGRSGQSGASSSAKPSTSTAASAATTISTSMGGLDASDLNLMAHVVNGEARGEPFIGQVAVAAVILNRLHSNKFPDTIPGIVYSPQAFSCVADGQINLTPTASTQRAVVLAAKGWDPTHGALFYFNPAKTSNAYMWSRPEIITIGDHIFTD